MPLEKLDLHTEAYSETSQTSKSTQIRLFRSKTQKSILHETLHYGHEKS